MDVNLEKGKAVQVESNPLLKAIRPGRWWKYVVGWLADSQGSSYIHGSQSYLSSISPGLGLFRVLPLGLKEMGANVKSKDFTNDL